MFISVRIFAWYAANHEEGINEYLSPRGIHVEGVEFRWSGINPVIQVDSIQAKGVFASDVQLEIDVLRSVWRNRISLLNFASSHVQVSFDAGDRDPPLLTSGATLAGLNMIGILLDAPNLHVPFTGIASANNSSQTIKGVLQSKTIGSRKEVLVHLKSEGSCGECGLFVQYAGHRASILHPDFNELLSATAHEFEFVSEAWNAPFLKSVTLNGVLDLQLRNGLGKAFAEIELGSAQSSQPSASLKGNLAMNLIKDEVHGLVRDAKFKTIDNQLDIPAIRLVSRGLGSSSHLWVDHVAIQTIVALLREFGNPSHPGVIWASELQPEGEIKDLHLLHNSRDVIVQANATDLQTQPYSGVPGFRISELAILGRNRDFLLELTATDMELDFPQWFDESRSFSGNRASVLLGLGTGHTGLLFVAEHMSYEENAIAGHFGINFEHATDRTSMGLVAGSNEIAVANVQKFIPRDTEGTIRLWLDDNLENGMLQNFASVFHSFKSTGSPQDSSIVEARVDLNDVLVRFHGDWPKLNDVKGQVWLTQRALDVHLDSCHSAGIFLNSGHVDVWFEDSSVAVSFSADAAIELLLDYIQSTPLSELGLDDLGEISGSGQADIESTLLFLPNSHAPSVSFTLTFDDAILSFGPDKTAIRQLSGSVLYSTPFNLSSKDLSGSILGNVGPIQLSTESLDEGSLLRVRHQSRFKPNDVVPYVGEWITEIAKGESELRMDMEYVTDGSKATTIAMESSLLGIELELPSPIGKKAEATRATNLRIELEDVPLVHLESGPINSVFVLRNDDELHGSIGLNVPPLDYGAQDTGLLVSGKLDSFGFVLRDGSNGFAFPSHVEVQELVVDHLEVQDFTFSNVVIDGVHSESGIDFTVSSNELIGRLSKSDLEPFVVEIDRIQIAEQPNGTSDPLDPAMLRWVPAMTVRVNDIAVLDQDDQETSYGSWSMFIDVQEDELKISELKGDVRGLLIDGAEDGGIAWNTTENTSHFIGSLQAQELQDVLTEWNYDPNVESRALRAEIDLKWPGSPLMFDLDASTGSLRGDLAEGRFLDVNAGGGALRILGLLNFATVLQRLRLDFKDVLREGTSFSRILFDVETDRGILQIDEPLHIKTTGSDIRLAGSMDMNTDALNLEVVATLPLSSSLPWWVGIATANPVAVISALVGKTVFEGQLDRMASMKYRVTGSLDDPAVQFVGLFRDSLEGENENRQEPPETVEGKEDND